MKVAIELFSEYPDTACAATGAILLLCSGVWSGVAVTVLGPVVTPWTIPGVLMFIAGGGLFLACIGRVVAEWEEDERLQEALNR